MSPAGLVSGALGLTGLEAWPPPADVVGGVDEEDEDDDPQAAAVIARATAPADSAVLVRTGTPRGRGMGRRR
jgi:hypothetical protein